MNRLKAFAVALIVTATTASCRGESVASTDRCAETQSDANKEATTDSIPAGAKALIEAYPDFIAGYDDGNILFIDGTTMRYDDGREKDFVTMLNDSDLEDMFHTPYTQPDSAPEYLSDAGRFRCESLFKKMYGNNPAAVRSNLETVDWFGRKIKFTGVNGAASQLRKVAEEIARYPELKPFMKCSGTFYWRKVRGANRQSAHSYGIAVDIAVDNSDYWLWKNPHARETDRIVYANRIPRRIVDIFRKYGFIWGGSWYHFDTMHFEYRPEILRYSDQMPGKR